MNEDCHYEDVVELPVDGPFLKVDGIPNMVKVPSVGDILGDKLTAYAPNTTGIPYFKKTQGGNERDCSMEIIKQLYDIARLFDEVPDLDITSKSFGRIAEVELSYRGLENNPKLIFDDVRQTFPDLNIIVCGIALGLKVHLQFSTDNPLCLGSQLSV